MYKHILIPTDGSELANKAVLHGIDLAKRLSARVTALIVKEPPRSFVAEGVVVVPAAEVAEVAERHAKIVLAGVSERAATAGVKVEVMSTLSDQPWRSIIDTARTKEADLIDMASHGRRGLSAMLLGSETQKVLTHSAIPVLVYR